MNAKTVFVGLGSAVFAAGLTYWVISPGRDVKMAKIAPGPAPAPLVISTAGPESTPPITPAPVTPTALAKPSPMPVASTETALRTSMPAPAPIPAQAEEPRSATLPPAVAAVPETVAAAPPAPVVGASTNPASPPPARVALNPPKEIDRVGTEAAPAVLHDRSRVPNTVTINQGTMITVRVGETLTVQKNLTGDTFFATLDAPLVADGFVIAEKGARVEGKIVEVDKAGRMSGSSRLSLELTQVNTSDGQRVHVQTSTYTKDGAERNRKNDAAKIGGGAVLGAIIGAAAGGGKGAGVGAGTGGAAGAGAVLLSGGRNVTIPVETKLSFRVEKPVIITERVVQ